MNQDLNVDIVACILMENIVCANFTGSDICHKTDFF